MRIEKIKVPAGAAAIIGLWLFIFSPSLGNAVASLFPVSRRMVQVLAAIGGATALGMFVLAPASGYMRAFWADNKKKMAVLALPPLALHLCAGLVKTFNSGLIPGPASIAHFIIAACWILFASIAFALFFSAEKKPEIRNTKYGSGSGLPTIMLAALVLFFMSAGWLVGPKPPDAFLSFGGHPAIAGVTYITAAFSLLWFPARGYGYAVFLLFIMLSALTTARMALLVGFIFLGLFCLKELKSSAGTLLSRLRRPLLAALACLLISLLPIIYSSTWFPYHVREHSEFSSPEYYRYGYAARYSRTLTAVPGPLEKYVLRFIEILPDNVPKDVAVGVVHAEESRRVIFSRTLSLIRISPAGYWPDARFAERSGLKSGTHEINYPHNLALDIAYSHGVPVGAFVAAGLLFLLYLLARDVLFSGSELVVVSAMSSLSYLVLFQFSGSLYDTIMVLVTGSVWFVSRSAALPRDALSEGAA